jgi:hypothetical protein
LGGFRGIGFRGRAGRGTLFFGTEPQYSAPGNVDTLA